MFLTACEMPDDDARQPGIALDAHEIIRKNRHLDDQSPAMVRDFICPERLFEIRQRRADDFEIFGAAGVGADKKPVAMIFDIIVLPRRARLDETGCCMGVSEIEQIDLRRIMIVHADECKAPGLAAPDMNEQARIALLENTDVGCGIAA